MSSTSDLLPLPLPEGITENYVRCTATGLTYHILESGYSPSRDKPLLLLLHGFPELALSWRKIMPTLAQAGYYVVAPDQRGYGRTTGWANVPYDQVDLHDYTMTNLVRDLVVLVYALGYREVRCVVGHDFGSVAASMCAMMRPDIFTSCITMSHPFTGTPSPPFNVAHSSPNENTDTAAAGTAGRDIQTELAALPEPRKHYKWYNSSSSAAHDWAHPPQGMHSFLRGYFHTKSASYTGADATPHPLKAWSAEALSVMPYYYILPLNSTIAEAIATMMAPGQKQDASATESWLPDSDLSVYVQEWQRTGFQGALNWYRASADPSIVTIDLFLFAGRKLSVPAAFISGERDWGNYQQPGAVENLERVCERFFGVRLIDGAGHWPQQEKPAEVADAVLHFLREVKSSKGSEGERGEGMRAGWM